MTRFLLFSLTLALALPALAQDAEPPVILVQTAQCDLDRVDDLVEQDTERWPAIFQALKDEGKLIQAGSARHAWGDAQNVLYWMTGADMESVIAASDEAFERYGEAYDDPSLFAEVCGGHRDFFYTRAAGTQVPRMPAGNDASAALAVSYYACSDVGDLLDAYRERGLPIAQAVVDDGALISEALLTHLWADEWNVVLSRVATDLPALLDALDAGAERAEATYGEDSDGLQDMLQANCTAHRDNIYQIVWLTN